MDEIIQKLNDWYGQKICGRQWDCCHVSIFLQNGKIVCKVGSNYIRERRRGRGIQAMRLINCIGGKPLYDKTIVWGKETTLTVNETT